MLLVVAEKPSVARDFARVLGVRATGRHAFEGEHAVITWCVGHLVELEEPAAYDARWRSWRLETLPMVPGEFRLRPSQHGADQLRVVTRLLGERRFRSIVNACDAGREGELIFRYVYQYAGARTPVQRLWISSLTDEAIRRGFGALEPAARFDALADAARSRSEADWLVGMNATRAITARRRDQGGDALYSIGRVQTPTLAMLVSREQAIREFVPRDYWEVRGDFTTAEGERFSAGWRARHGGALVARLGRAELAAQIVARDAQHAAAKQPHGPRVERVRARQVREPPPLLFDLTSLQRTANRRFGWAAARTLELAQALYERHKVLTYPRTDSRHLTTDMVGELPGVFAALARLPVYAPFAAPLVAQPPRPGRRIVDDTKVTDHHAIIPTGSAERAADLDRDEARLFDLVVRRFLGAFYPDAEFAVTEAWIRVALGEAPAVEHEPSRDRPEERSDDLRATDPTRGPARADAAPDADRPILEEAPPPPDRYLARGRVRLVAGWQDVAGIGPAGTNEGARARRGEDEGGDRRGDDDEPMGALPRLVEGQALDGAFAAIAKQTRPPPRYTEATLLGAMESAGKQFDDEALRAAMRDCGLGTPATRASIIETLLRRDFILRERQHLVPTPTGIGLIRALPVASLASPELTGRWEQRLARVARGEEARAAFMADIVRYVTDTVDAIRVAPPPDASPPGRPPGPPPTGGPEEPRASTWTQAPAGPPQERRASTWSQAPVARRPPPSEDARRPPPSEDARRPPPSEDARRPPRSEDARRPPPSEVARRPPPSELRMTRAGGKRPKARPGGGKRERTERRATWADVDMVAAEQLERTASPFATTMPGTRRRKQAPATDRSPRASSSASPRSSGGAASPKSGVPGGAASPKSRVPGGAASPKSRVPSAGATPKPSPHCADAASPAPPSRKPKADANAGLHCPRCKVGELIAGQRGWGCARWREGCRFVIWFETAGRRLTAAQLRDLITRGKTRKTTFRPNGGRGPEDGRLVLAADRDNGSAVFEPA